MGHVTKVHQDERSFFANMEVSGFTLTVRFDTEVLRRGHSLQRLMNEQVRTILKSHPRLIDERDLKDTAKEAVVLLRDKIEPYFAEQS